MYPSSYDACVILVQQGAFVATYMHRGQKNGTAHFHHNLPKYLSSIQQAFKAWLDDVDLHSNTEAEQF